MEEMKMSRLSKLFGKAKEFEIGGEIFEIKPLSIAHLDLVMDMSNPAKASASMKKVINLTLKQSVPDATEDEINNVAMQYFKDFSEAISDVNGLKQQ